jgi:hypothetical protein
MHSICFSLLNFDFFIHNNEFHLSISFKNIIFFSYFYFLKDTINSKEFINPMTKHHNESTNNLQETENSIDINFDCQTNSNTQFS